MRKTTKTVIIALFVAVIPVFGFAYARPQATLAETETEAKVRTTEMSEWRAKLEELKTAKTEVKERVRLQTAEKAQEIAQKRVQKLIERMKSLKTSVSASTLLTDSEKATVNEKIDAEIVKLEDVATAVKDATTVDAIKAAVAEARTQANTSMQEVRKLIIELRGTRLHNITKHLTEILERLTVKVEALTLTDEQKTEFTNLDENVKASIAKADTAIDAKDYAGVKTNVAAAKNDLLSMIRKINEINNAANTAETD